jgi:hypothetical protein
MIRHNPSHAAFCALYLFVPVRSPLWRWPVCTACGVIAGVLVIALWIGGIPGVGGTGTEAWSLYVIAAIVDGVTLYDRRSDKAPF